MEHLNSRQRHCCVKGCSNQPAKGRRTCGHHGKRASRSRSRLISASTYLSDNCLPAHLPVMVMCRECGQWHQQDETHVCLRPGWFVNPVVIMDEVNQISDRMVAAFHDSEEHHV